VDVDSLYGHDLHAKRVDALAAVTLGVMTGTSLAVAMICQALAQARGPVTKHAIKQVSEVPSVGYDKIRIHDLQGIIFVRVRM
jgi:hypothetical protein